jgi:hypothetical protein
VPPSERPCRITWREETPTPAQRAAWDKLWTRLLGHPGPETPQPQEDTPGAVDGATVSGGHNLSKEQDNDSTHCPFST